MAKISTFATPGPIMVAYLSETKRLITANLQEGISGVFLGLAPKMAIFPVFGITGQTEDIIFGNCFFIFRPFSLTDLEAALNTINISSQDKPQFLSALQSVQNKIMSSTSPEPCIVATLKALPLMVRTIFEIAAIGFLLYETTCKNGEIGIVIVIFRFKNVAGELRDFSVVILLRTFIEASTGTSDTYRYNNGFISGRVTEVTASLLDSMTCKSQMLLHQLQCHGSGASAVQCIAKHVVDYVKCINGR